MLITETVQVNVNSYTIKYYENLGYVLPRKENGKYKLYAPFTVNVKDLPQNSTTKVEYTCDYCGKHLIQPYNVYTREMSGIIQKTCCAECNHLKVMESNQKIYGCNTVLELDEVKEKVAHTVQEKYGVNNILDSPIIRERIEKTNYAKYGVNVPSKTQEVKNKIIETNIKKYGCNAPTQNEDILNKVRQTTLEHYGCENVSQSEIVKKQKVDTQLERYGMLYCKTEEGKNKAAQTCLSRYGNKAYIASDEGKKRTKEINMEKYGYENPFESPEIQMKIREAYYENDCVCTSSQQKYISQLFKMTINYPILYWNVDMFDNNNLICEYDGGGHRLSVKLGNLTNEEFNQKEIVRNNMIKRAGYKMMRIISTHDLLPSDTILIQMLSDAKQYFSDYPEHSWINFDIDNNLVRNAEHKEGIPYFYGELRKIKKTDLESA